MAMPGDRADAIRDPVAPSVGALRHTMSRRGAIGSFALAAAAPAAAAVATGCNHTRAPVSARTGEFAGTFDFMVQNFQPTINVLERVIAKLHQQHPGLKITYAPTPFGEMATKHRTSVAAGSGPDGFHTYSSFWRGTDAATVMLALTPILFKRSELEQLFFSNVLDSVWSRRREIYMLPFSDGVGAGMVVYNEPLLAAAGVDPRTFTTLDAVIAAARKLVVRESGTVTRAGWLPGAASSVVPRWILDQGGKFYDEQAFRWTWQTVEAERALQWILDLYNKHAVAWRQPPPGVRDALGEGHAAMHNTGAFAISQYRTSHPDTKLADVPMPGFVTGKPPNYFTGGVSGWSLSPLLKADDAKARIGALLYRELATPDALVDRANEYSGALMARGVYTDPRFKQTRFAASRARFPEQVISKIKLMTMAADPGAVDGFVAKVVAGQLSIKASLAKMQQQFTAQEEERRRTMG